MKEQSVTRLRVNIVDFDLQKFLLYMENPDSVSCDPEFKQVPYLLQYLEALKCLPLKSKARHWDQSSIITQLSQLAGIPACHRLNTLKTQLYHRFKCNSSRFSSLHSPRRLSCFCFAKHLCGSATDYALQYVVFFCRFFLALCLYSNKEYCRRKPSTVATFLDDCSHCYLLPPPV
jgi:hypothetical protein